MKASIDGYDYGFNFVGGEIMYKYNKKIAILFILYRFMFVFAACSNSGSNHDVVFIIDDSLDNVVIKVKKRKLRKLMIQRLAIFNFLDGIVPITFMKNLTLIKKLRKIQIFMRNLAILS